MKLSIIIPTKNEEKELPSLFESLKKQTLKDVEVIVADANSTDRTREIAKSHGARIALGGMPGEGRNRGAEHAHGDIYLFLDADVYLPTNDYLEHALHEMKEKDIDVCTVGVAADSKHRLDRYFFGAYNCYVKLTERIFPHAPGFCIFVKKNVHEAIRGFDERVKFAEDMDYVQRAARHGYRFRILKSVPAIPTSVRRFEKDGHWRIAFKFAWAELRMIFFGPFLDTSPFRYEMGGDKKGGRK